MGFLSVPDGVSGLSVSSVSSLGMLGKKETQRTHLCVVPWVPRSTAVLLFSLSFQSHLMYILCVPPRVFRCTYEEQGKVHLLHLPTSLPNVV